MGEEEPQVLILINEKQCKFTALTLRLKLLTEKTKRFKQPYFNTRKRKKISLSGAIYFMYYFLAMPL